VSAEEILDVVDVEDRVVGRLPRAEVYARRLVHRCVFVLVRDGAGRIFVHRRTDDKLTYPGRHDMFVGGVVGAGESYDAAAVREAAEELGVSTPDTPGSGSASSTATRRTGAGGRPSTSCATTGRCTRRRVRSPGTAG
jgi:isopentenyldiphosphate isomerase